MSFVCRLRRVPANGKLYPMIRFWKKIKNCHELLLLNYFEIYYTKNKVRISLCLMYSLDDSARVRANVISQYYLLRVSMFLLTFYRIPKECFELKHYLRVVSEFKVLHD